MTNFLHSIPKPIIGLSPMDGITDHAMRYIYAITFKPDIMFTEFINVEAIRHGQPQVYEKLRYRLKEKPLILQLSGIKPESFYWATLIGCYLGFNGIDINLGCPSRTVVKSGGGAALIGQTRIVKAIIDHCRKAIGDYRHGFTLSDLPIKAKNHQKLAELRKTSGTNSNKHTPTLSVKTRIGFDKPAIDTWIKWLLSLSLDFITIHGRTAKQMYTGEADWHSIARAVAMNQSKTLILGNGDIIDQQTLLAKVKTSRVNGVLIGRGALGNPWIFNNLTRLKSTNTSAAHIPAKAERLAFMQRHLAYFVQTQTKPNILPFRKFFGWYCRGFPEAKKMRILLIEKNRTQSVQSLLKRSENIV